MPPTALCRGLSRTYRSPGGDVPVLAGVDLSVEAGEAVAVLGPSGSGKSTLLHLLGGLDRPDSGEVWWQGFPVHEHAPAALATRRARYVGMVFQNHYLLSDLTVLENVSLPSRIVGEHDEASARRLLEAVGLGARLGAHPQTLSGGERQRAAVARALSMSPKLLLADEPTGSLDRASAEAVLRLLLDLAADRGAAVLIVTHDEALVDAAGVPTVRLEGGRIAQRAPELRPRYDAAASSAAGQ